MKAKPLKDTVLITGLPKREIHLIGRKQDLQILEERLEKTRLVLLVNGLGGIGKTEVCKTFFMDHYKEFSYAGWIDYVSSIKESLVNSIKTELVKGHEKNTLDERFNKVIAFLQHLPPDSLLVIDNIEDPADEDIDKIKTLPFKVIANSRLNLDGFANHTLDFLSAESCKALFYQRYKGESHDEIVEKIVELCGRHTLTVELLARTAQNAALPVKRLYDQLVEKGFNLNDVIGEKVGTFWHNEKTKKQFFHHLLKIFELSNVTDSELNVLTNLSVLPAIYISKEKIKEWLELETMDDINSLVHKGWLMQEGLTVFIHQVIQEVIRYRTMPDVKKCKNLIVSLTNKLDLDPVENPIEKKEFVPFVDSLLSYIEEKDQCLAELSNNLSRIYWAPGQLEKALEFQLKALKIREEVLDRNHPDLANSYHNLSNIYLEKKDYSSALRYSEKAVAILQRLFPNGHPDLDKMKNHLEKIKRAME